MTGDTPPPPPHAISTAEQMETSVTCFHIMIYLVLHKTHFSKTSVQFILTRELEGHQK